MTCYTFEHKKGYVFLSQKWGFSLTLTEMYELLTVLATESLVTARTTPTRFLQHPCVLDFLSYIWILYSVDLQPTCDQNIFKKHEFSEGSAAFLLQCYSKTCLICVLTVPVLLQGKARAPFHSCKRSHCQMSFLFQWKVGSEASESCPQKGDICHRLWSHHWLKCRAVWPFQLQIPLHGRQDWATPWTLGC